MATVLAVEINELVCLMIVHELISLEHIFHVRGQNRYMRKEAQLIKFQ